MASGGDALAKAGAVLIGGGAMLAVADSAVLGRAAAFGNEDGALETVDDGGSPGLSVPRSL